MTQPRNMSIPPILGAIELPDWLSNLPLGIANICFHNVSGITQQLPRLRKPVLLSIFQGNPSRDYRTVKRGLNGQLPQCGFSAVENPSGFLFIAPSFRSAYSELTLHRRFTK